VVPEDIAKLAARRRGTVTARAVVRILRRQMVHQVERALQRFDRIVGPIEADAFIGPENLSLTKEYSIERELFRHRVQRRRALRKPPGFRDRGQRRVDVS
jgi:hypothetical protein